MDVSGLNVCRYDYLPGWKLVSHRHEGFYQVFYVIDGAGLAWIDQEPFPIEGGCVLLIAPGVAHVLRPTGNAPLRTLDAKFKLLAERIIELGQIIPPIQYPDEPEIYCLLEAVREEAERRAPLFREVCQVKLKELILRLARIQVQSRPLNEPRSGSILPKPRVANPIVEKLGVYLQSHYAEPITSRKLARDLAYSYRHISEATRLSYGMTPMRLLMHYRIHFAQEEILKSGSTLKETAANCGFTNVHHFSRVFTNIVGIAPGQWRDHSQNSVYKHFAILEGFRDRDRTSR